MVSLGKTIRVWRPRISSRTATRSLPLSFCSKTASRPENGPSLMRTVSPGLALTGSISATPPGQRSRNAFDDIFAHLGDAAAEGEKILHSGRVARRFARESPYRDGKKRSPETTAPAPNETGCRCAAARASTAKILPNENRSSRFSTSFSRLTLVWMAYHLSPGSICSDSCRIRNQAILSVNCSTQAAARLSSLSDIRADANLRCCLHGKSALAQRIEFS